MNLILIFPQELDPSNCVQLTDERAGHIRNVLRAEPGGILRIGLLNGPLGRGTVEKIAGGSVELSCVWEQHSPARPAIDLLLAMPRPKVLKRLWAQFAALGIGRIFITNAEKVERYYFDTHILDPTVYTPRLIEGLQQARDTRLPDVQIVRRLKPFIEDQLDPLFPAPGKRVLADPSATRSLFHTLHTEGCRPACSRAESSRNRVLLGVGPEGGWTPFELDLFRKNGFDLFSMGPRILRTDTACIGLISLLAEAAENGV